MPWQYAFTGAALGAFLALVGSVLGTGLTLGYAWYRAALTEQKSAITDEKSELEKARLKVIRQKLQSFYIRAGEILNRPLQNPAVPDEFAQFVNDYNAYHNETLEWIKQNLGEAAAARFVDQSSSRYLNYSRAIGTGHNEIINMLVAQRTNLTRLIESNAWDNGVAEKLN